MLDLYNYSLLTIFLAGLALIVAASEIGRLTGAARAEAARRKEFRAQRSVANFSG
jgi:hypothetical protein